MELKVTPAASQWLIQSLQLKSGDGVKFFTHSGGANGKVNYGPRQGYAKENTPQSPVLRLMQDGIDYHIDNLDSWFFSGKTTTVDYDEIHGLTFHFQNGQGQTIDATTGASKGNVRFEELWD